jgi:hypothetical protein
MAGHGRASRIARMVDYGSVSSGLPSFWERSQKVFDQNVTYQEL